MLILLPTLKNWMQYFQLNAFRTYPILQYLEQHYVGLYGVVLGWGAMLAQALHVVFFKDHQSHTGTQRFQRQALTYVK